MSPRTIATVGILLLEVALAGCASETVENRSDLNSTVCSGPKWKPIGNRKIRVVHWGIIHNHSKGKWDAVRLLKDDFELVGWVDDRASKAMRMSEPRVGTYTKDGAAWKILAGAKRVVACDGASDAYCRRFGKSPFAVVGDMDSIGHHPEGSEIVTVPDQSTNDLSKAVGWCRAKGFKKLVVVGAMGKR